MNPETAQRCGVHRLVDDRWAGIARGVGSAKIIGRVHSAQIKLGSDLFLACSFEVMEGDVDLLCAWRLVSTTDSPSRPRHAQATSGALGHAAALTCQACIDLEKNELRIQGRSVPFLAEHELPQMGMFSAEADACVFMARPC